jgi:exopolysaccharide biosynthesis polyprenyl glycosylphosphotransferase
VAARVRFRDSLSEVDIRQRLDEAVHRGWAEIGRRVMRVAVLVSADIALALLAAALVTVWSAGLSLGSLHSVEGLRWAAALIVLVQPLTLGVLGAYEAGRHRTSFERVLGGVLLAAILGWVRSLLLDVPAGEWVFLAYAAAAVPLIFLGRVLVDRVVSGAYERGIGTRRLLLVANEHEAAGVRTILESAGAKEIQIVGRISPQPHADGDALGTLPELEAVLRDTRARGVVVSSNLHFNALERLTRQCFELGATISVVPRTLHQLKIKMELRTTRSGALVNFHSTGLGLPQLAIKRAMDLVLCALGLVLVIPVGLLIAIAIKLDSRGPVLFRQERAGVGGRSFWMYKFRTMQADADGMKAQLEHLNESGDPRLFKIRMDPRITRFGRLLRKTSLDELPQIINVLRGEMSLVGPRPFFPNDLAGYEDHHFERLFVLPGITGLWQVSGRSDVVDFEEVVRLDAEYIRTWSIGRDLYLLLRTLPAAMRRGGAY